MNDKKVMQMALNANTVLLEFIGMTSKSDFSLALAKVTEANKELRAALAQPDKEWVGLTDNEYELMAEKRVTNYFFNTLDYAHAIEAKLKEKNT